MKLRTLVLGAVAGLFLAACGGAGGSTPEAITESFVKALAAGDCDKAITMATGNAKETVEGTKESGCEAYETEIVGSVTCETEEESAKCVCTEKRSLLGEMKFNYNLTKVDGEWKVSKYQKDMGDMGMGGE